MQNAPIGKSTALTGTIFVTISVFMSRAYFRATSRQVLHSFQATHGQLLVDFQAAFRQLPDNFRATFGQRFGNFRAPGSKEVQEVRRFRGSTFWIDFEATVTPF